MLGRLLAEWGGAPAGCLFLLPLWHPVLVAEQIGTLASIAPGPFIMQCGLGYGDAWFAAMGHGVPMPLRGIGRGDCRRMVFGRAFVIGRPSARAFPPKIIASFAVPRMYSNAAEEYHVDSYDVS